MLIVDKILDLVFPPTCEICGKVGSYICNKCYCELEKYKYYNRYRTKYDKKENKYYLFQYKGIIRELLIEYKFNDKSYLRNLFADIILKNEFICKIIKSYDIIIPVPLHKKRMNERGYNQSELILKQINKKMPINIRNDIIKKIKNIRPQSEKGYSERQKDIKNAFKIKNDEIIKNKNILLFDDIYTTGSTTNECRKILKNSGANKISIMTVAKD